jgi:hypothetical protein
MALAGAAQAQVHKCIGPDGKAVFQGDPCDGAKPAAPAAKSAPPPAASDRGLKEQELRKASKCDEYSGIVEDTIRNQRSGYQGKVDEFRRECLALGFRFPDLPSSVAHNKALYATLVRDFEKQYGPHSVFVRSPEPAPRTAPPVITKAVRCFDISRGLEEAIRRGSLYSGDNAAFVVEFRTECQQMGYRFPDSNANAEHNKTRFYELTSSK